MNKMCLLVIRPTNLFAFAFFGLDGWCRSQWKTQNGEPFQKLKKTTWTPRAAKKQALKLCQAKGEATPKLRSSAADSGTKDYALTLPEEHSQSKRWEADLENIAVCRTRPSDQPCNLLNQKTDNTSTMYSLPALCWQFNFKGYWGNRCFAHTLQFQHSS